MAEDTDRYCALEFEDFTFNDEKHLLYSHFARALAALPANAVRVLRTCGSSVAPLETHVEQCTNKLLIPEAQRPALTDLIRALARVGLLVSERDVVKRIRDNGLKAESFTPLRTVGIITRHRPDLLERGLVNLAANARRFGRGMTVIVACDGGEEDDAAARAVLARARDVYGVQSVLLGTSERLALVRSLGAQLPEDVVRFAIGRGAADIFAPGAVRNLLLLRAGGERVVFVDDDTMGRFASFGGTTELVLTNRRDPTQFRFFADRQSSLSEAPISDDLDFFGVHDRWLGKTPSTWVDVAISLADSPVALGRFLDGERTARVMLTQFGVVGNSGMQSPHYVYAVDGPTRSALYSLGADFRRYLLARDVHRFVERPTISPVGFCMTGCLGIDARGLLPPFAPHFYNEDGTFGAALGATLPGAFTAFLPASIVHDPSGDRAVPSFDEVLRRAGNIRCNDALILLLRLCSTAPAGADPAVGMRSIGAQLVAMSDSEPSFREVLLLAVCRDRERFLGALRRAAMAADTEASELKADLEALILAYEAALRKPGEGVAVDIGGAPDRSVSRLREYVRAYGRLLQAWPDIVRIGQSIF
jgi:hypothetical protein